MKTQFNSLVENALDFFEKSVLNLDAGETKYSVINFYSGLELFLKARLLEEHWSLCAADIRKLTKAKFVAGDFESVGLVEARNRLANIIGCDILDAEWNIYDKLRKRRNQAVHFYHPGDLISGNKVAVEQLVAWHFLYPRLTDLWKSSFKSFHNRLKSLHGSIATRKEYFPSIYAELKDSIQKQAKDRPVTFCAICDQKSALTHGEIVGSLHKLDCLVCGGETYGVFLPCKKCGKLAPRIFEVDTECQWCLELHKADVIESFAWGKTSFPDSHPLAWCGDCGYTVTESVIDIQGMSFCLACYSFYIFSVISKCEYCGSAVTGSVGSRTVPGCVRCEYSLRFEEKDEEIPEYMFAREERRDQRFLRTMGYI